MVILFCARVVWRSELRIPRGRSKYSAAYPYQAVVIMAGLLLCWVCLLDEKISPCIVSCTSAPCLWKFRRPSRAGNAQSKFTLKKTRQSGTAPAVYYCTIIKKNTIVRKQYRPIHEGRRRFAAVTLLMLGDVKRDAETNDTCTTGCFATLEVRKKTQPPLLEVPQLSVLRASSINSRETDVHCVQLLPYGIQRLTLNASPCAG